MLAILAVALAALLGVQAALEWQASPYGLSPLLDEEGYILWARRIAQGDLLGAGVFYQDPLWPYVLAGLLRLFDGSLLAARLSQVAIGLGTLGFTWLFARRMHPGPRGARAALVALCLLSLCGVHAYYQAVLLKATLAANLCALSLWLSARAQQEGRGRDWFALGIALAAFSLVRGNALALGVIACGAALWPARTAGASNPSGLDHARVPFIGRSLRAAALLAGLALVLFPVALRNRLVGGEWVLTTSQAGQNFYIGNNPLADGAYAALPFVRAGPQWEAADFQAHAERRAGRPLRAGEVSSYFLRESLRWISAHPADAARLWARKLWLLFDSYEIPDNESFACMRRWFMPSLRVGFLSWGILLGPALLGLWLCLRERRSVLAALLAIVYAATLVSFFVVSRYRFPLLPAAAVYAGYFAVWLADSLAARSFKAAAGAAGAAVALSLLAHAPSPLSRRESTYLAHCAQTSGATLLAQDQPERALPLLEEAAQLEPAVPDHRFNLALARQRSGDLRGAQASYRDALRLAPGDKGALRNLALLLLAEGKCGEARALFTHAARAPDDALAQALRTRCPGL